jgi:hypothetical protein
MGSNRSRVSAALAARLTAGLLALATITAGLVVALGAAPAQAGWTDVGAMTHFRVCKETTPAAKGWIFLARARKRTGTDDARAGMVLRADGERRQRWSSGWLRGREVERGWVRTQRSGRVRLHVWQEAGDRDSGIGTALEREVLRPRQVERCG